MRTRFHLASLVLVPLTVGPLPLATAAGQTAAPPAGPQANPPQASPSQAASAGTPPPASPYPPAVAATTPVQPVAKVVVPADEQLDVKYVRQTCLDYAQSEGLKADAADKAVSACVAKVRPDLAGKP